MTFEEAKLAKAERDVGHRAYEARQKAKQKLAGIIKEEVCLFCEVGEEGCEVRGLLLN